ncbi:MAG: hypothetical protein M3O09_00015 [Acidobacteriota bacterium]|nr:hypothetical protein [Acidobacteriota bacterium]
MKPKKLEKKVGRLEALLRKGKKKLSKLKRKIKAASKAATEKKNRKSTKCLEAEGASNEAALALDRRASDSRVEGTRRSEGTSQRKVKQTRSLTPEGRAKLSAAMKARWAAKRAPATV